MLKRCLLILLLGIILSGCQKNEVGYIGQTDDMGTDIIEQTVTEEENFVDIVIGKTKRQEKILLKCLDTYLIPQFGICSEYLNKNESNTIQVECFKSDGNLEMLQKQVTGIQDVFIEDFDNDGNLEMFLVVINGEDTIDYANNCDFCLYKYSVREDEFEERQYETRESGIFSYLNREYIIDGNVVDGTIIEMMSLQIGAQYLENVAISFYNDIDEAAKSVLLEEVTQSTDKKGYYQYQFLNVENEEKKYPSLPVMTAVFTSFERGVENHIEESVMRYIGTTEQNGMTVYISDMEQEVEPLFEYPFDYENAKEAFYKDMSQYNLGIYADEDKRSPMFKIECLNGTDNYQYAYTSFNNHNYLFDYIDSTLIDIEGKVRLIKNTEEYEIAIDYYRTIAEYLYMTGLNGIETEQQFMEEDVLRLYLTLCAAGNVQDAPIIFNEENGYCEVPGEYVKQIISERITNADSHINKGVWKTTYNEFNNLVYDEERDVFCYYPGGEYFAWLEDVIMSMNISQQPDDLVHVEVVWNNFYRQNLYFPMNEYKKLMRVTTSAPADFGE